MATIDFSITDAKLLNLEALPRVQWQDRRKLPQEPGIYFVFQGEELLYIGKAVNLKARWKHHNRGYQFSLTPSVQIAYWQRNAGEDLEGLERLCCRAFQPRLNGTKIVYPTYVQLPKQYHPPRQPRPAGDPPSSHIGSRLLANCVPKSFHFDFEPSLIRLIAPNAELGVDLFHGANRSLYKAAVILGRGIEITWEGCDTPLGINPFAEMDSLP